MSKLIKVKTTSTQTRYKIDKQEAVYLLNVPLEKGESPVSRIALITTLLQGVDIGESLEDETEEEIL